MKNVKKIEIKLEKEWVESLDAVFKKKNKDVKIDGFRKGNVPKDIYLNITYLKSRATTSYPTRRS